MKIKILCMLAFASVSTMVHAQNGNVGIGTNNPASKLTVNGNASIGSGYTGTAAPANGAIIQGNVGIGTSAPQAKLHVGGFMRLDTAKVYTGTDASVLVRDNATGEVMTAVTNTGNDKPVNYVEYTLTAYEILISDYDTKIPVDNYTLTVVGSALNFSNNGANAWLKTDGTGMPSNNSGFNPLNISTFSSGGTWHIKANYPDGLKNVYSGDHAIWTIRCLAFNSTFIQTLPDINTDLGGHSTTASALTPPAGI